ncbi:MAG: hypothetical protein ABSE48_02375 [Verrucomicrobiota bacterium]
MFALFAVNFYSHAHAFAVEDQIHGTFYPLAMALYDFELDHNSPAANLAQLVPQYIAHLPSSRYADSIKYTVIDSGNSWQLNIYSRALSEPRIYCCRSTQKFTEDEERRVLLRYHAIWTVFKAQ